VQIHSLAIADLRPLYLARTLTATQLVDHVFQVAEAARPRNIWITRLTLPQVMAYVRVIERKTPEELPLYGIPFVVKDNIDLTGVPTTAACPDFAYLPSRSATVVQKLIDAGAIPLGKANLDQFATGLVGTRSPYGPCGNSFNADFVSGGSSSGSAVAVATGLASFSLGTDTAGSGRVPAGFNNIVGLKPTLGRLSTQGVLPACRSVDTISIFALTTDDAAAVLNVAEGFDAPDAYSRPVRNRALTGMRFGVPQPNQLQFFGDADYARCFKAATDRLQELGGIRVEIDFAAFLDAARLLYEGPWVAERYAAVGEFLEAHPHSVFPVTRQIIEAGKKPSAAAAFQAQYRLMDLKRTSEAAWSHIDFIVTPTAGTIYTIAALEADPIRLNSNLGYYTNYVNLFDLAAVALPAGFRADGLPFGVTLVGPNSSDRGLPAVADRLHRAGVRNQGALQLPLPAPKLTSTPTAANGYVTIAVCGAHMSGLTLNHQLRDRGGYFLQSTATAPHYRLFALPGGPPHRPGMVRVNSGGVSIEIELWALPTEAVGGFIAAIPAPLGIGSVALAAGSTALGFVCEAHAIEAAIDISAHGGWRAFQQSQKG
jgi:allophanate hydrolase